MSDFTSKIASHRRILRSLNVFACFLCGMSLQDDMWVPAVLAFTLAVIVENFLQEGETK